MAKKTESILDGALEVTADGILVVGRGGAVEKLNLKFIELWKIPESLIAADSHRKLLDFVADQLKNPDEFLKVVNDLYINIEAEKFDTLEFKDGRVFERYSKPLRQNGVVTGRVWSFRDVTEQKKAEQQLKESEAKYRDLVELLPDTIYETNEDLDIVYVNPAGHELFGYTEDDVKKGVNLADLIASEDKEQAFAKIGAILKGEITRPAEYLVIKKNGTRFHSLVHSRPIFRDGRVIGLRGTLRDITERKKAEQLLQKLNDSLKLINNILRHDLSNDLHSIRGFMDLYLQTGNDKHLERVIKILEKCTDLISRMREFEHLILQEEPLTPHDARQLVEEVISIYPDQTAKFIVKGKGMVLAYPAISSAIDNLVRNALIHAGTGKIEITIEEKNGFCEIFVADQGPGIPEKVKELLFKPGFFHGSTGNTGFGLYIIKHVMERCGGEVKIKDNSPKGTVFILKLHSAKKK